MSAGTVDDVVALFGRWGADTYDERIGQLDHALQASALAAAAGAPEELVVAALLHDVGHLLTLDGADPASGHEDLGASWLRPLFPPAVTAPIALHVRAKRYLCAVEPGYLSCLSEGSVRSLAVQGGPMGSAEIEAFQGLASGQEAVCLRRFDDAAKAETVDVPGLSRYLPVMQRVIARPAAGGRAIQGHG